jgi:hypothetical protein
MSSHSPSQLADAEIEALLQTAAAGIESYLSANAADIRPEILASARQNVFKNLTSWLRSKSLDRLSPNAKLGIALAIRNQRWERLVDAFIDDIAFGTGGIRGVAAFASRADESELDLLATPDIGITTRILRGPNTINDVVLMLKSTGVARYARDEGLKQIVIGYDSRLQGCAFAELIAKIFLAAGMRVYLFDDPCPYPEITFAIPHLQADLGILISASHNDRRYNGYKLSNHTGAQFEKSVRDR